MNRNLKSVLAMVLCLVLVAAMFAGCGKEKPIPQANLKQAEYNTYTATMPSTRFLMVVWIISAPYMIVTAVPDEKTINIHSIVAGTYFL